MVLLTATASELMLVVFGTSIMGVFSLLPADSERTTHHTLDRYGLS